MDTADIGVSERMSPRAKRELIYFPFQQHGDIFCNHRFISSKTKLVNERKWEYLGHNNL